MKITRGIVCIGPVDNRDGVLKLERIRVYGFQELLVALLSRHDERGETLTHFGFGVLNRLHFLVKLLEQFLGIFGGFLDLVTILRLVLGHRFLGHRGHGLLGGFHGLVIHSRDPLVLRFHGHLRPIIEVLKQ